MKKAKEATQNATTSATNTAPAVGDSVKTIDLTAPAKRLNHLAQNGLGHIVNTNRVVSISPYPILVTPEMATAFLEHNTANRSMSKNNMFNIKGCLMRGKWRLTSDALTFDFEGVLTNGQTRLNAIIESGVAASLIVGFGIEQSEEMDTGAKRSAWDVIYMKNLGDGTTQDRKIVGTVRAMLRRHIRGNGSATNEETIEAYLEWQPYLIDMAHVITSYHVGDVWLNAALVAAYMNGVSLADIEEFKREYVAENSQAPEHQIILDLRMQNRIQSGGGTDENHATKYRSAQYALYAFVNRTGQTTVPFGLTNHIWDYDTMWLNEDENGNQVHKRYFA